MQGMYLKRSFTHRFDTLFSTFSVIIVTGARQVGKSTFLDHTLKGKADFVVFDPVVDVENARQDPDLFLNNHNMKIICTHLN